MLGRAFVISLSKFEGKKSVAKMSGGFFFEHIVEFLLPKSDAQKVAEAEAKQKKSSDQKVQLKK